MKRTLQITIFILISAGCLTLVQSCKKNVSLPTLLTQNVSNITQSSATISGNVMNDGGAEVTDRGVAWSKNPIPYVSDSKSQGGNGSGEFTAQVTGLYPNTTYYVRAYANNSAGTGYGNVISFTTKDGQFGLATLTTIAVTSITDSSAVSGGIIIDEGNSYLNNWGICWSTSPNPTVQNDSYDLTGNPLNLTTFVGYLTGLSPQTTYYVRAYATNDAGASYGNEISFITAPEQVGLASLTTDEVTSINSNSAISGGKILDSGNSNITDWGICWSTSAHPTILNDRYSWPGTLPGSGSFVGYLTGLSAQTKYYVRAYATNSAGTAYGNEWAFTTTSIGYGTIHFNSALTYGSIMDIDGNEYKTIQIGTQNWMAENLRTTKYNDGSAIPNVSDNDQWAKLTSGAYCWYKNDSGTYEAVFGALYNWYAAASDKLCPTGWHVPSSIEWNTLITYLGGAEAAGGKLKEEGTYHWLSTNTEATNESGFTALPGGIHDYTIDDLGPWVYVGSVGSWWSSTSGTGQYYPSLILNLFDTKAYLVDEGQDYHSGISVRCLKD